MGVSCEADRMEHAPKRMRARLAGVSRLSFYRDCLIAFDAMRIRSGGRAALRGWQRFATFRHGRRVRRATPATREKRWLAVLRTLLARRRAACPRLPEFMAEVSRRGRQELEAPAIVEAIRRMRSDQLEAVPREWINPAVAEELSRAAETDAHAARDIRSVLRFRRAGADAIAHRRRPFERSRRGAGPMLIPARLRPAARRARLRDCAVRSLPLRSRLRAVSIHRTRTQSTPGS